MSQAETPVGSSIVAVYPDHAAAEKAIQQLHEAGFAKCDLSIIGRDFQLREEPVGFISPGDYAKAGAATGASFGGLFGLLVGAAVVLIPGVGPVIVAGPLAAALLAGVEGAIAGTALGSLAGRWSAGESRRSGPSSTRRRSREASSSSWFGASPRSSHVPGACSIPTRRSILRSMSRRRGESECIPGSVRLVRCGAVSRGPLGMSPASPAFDRDVRREKRSRAPLVRKKLSSRGDGHSVSMAIIRYMSMVLSCHSRSPGGCDMEPSTRLSPGDLRFLDSLRLAKCLP